MQNRVELGLDNNQKLDPKNFLLIYCTVPDEQIGEKISRHLLSKKLIACANLFPQGQSFYEWKGEFQNSSEVVLICKTKSSLYELVEKEIKKKHPYECPCITALSLSKAYGPFLKWIDEQCS